MTIIKNYGMLTRLIHFCAIFNYKNRYMLKSPILLAIIFAVLLTFSIITFAQSQIRPPIQIEVFYYQDENNICYMPTTNHGISCLPRVKSTTESSSSSSSLIQTTRGQRQ